TAVSNGCARLTNDHIQDLYGRVSIGTRAFLYAQTAT
ncbi:MAG: L,D-transpeptidase, partial [Paracoccaceae bacterium]|nr:L,D-transpeptidase [Paracoccaceae bacterium]